MNSTSHWYRRRWSRRCLTECGRLRARLCNQSRKSSQFRNQSPSSSRSQSWPIRANWSSTGQSKTVWFSLLTAIGAPIAAFGNLDWRVQLACDRRHHRLRSRLCYQVPRRPVQGGEGSQERAGLMGVNSIALWVHKGRGCSPGWLGGSRCTSARFRSRPARCWYGKRSNVCAELAFRRCWRACRRRRDLRRHVGLYRAGDAACRQGVDARHPRVGSAGVHRKRNQRDILRMMTFVLGFITLVWMVL
jgi:hypothetical protein